MQQLEALLTREEEILGALTKLEPGAELDQALQELTESMQQFQQLLAQLGTKDLSRADSSILGRLKKLKEKRELNAALLQNVLQANSEKLSALQLEKKAFNSYKPAGSKEPRLLDEES